MRLDVQLSFLETSKCELVFEKLSYKVVLDFFFSAISSVHYRVNLFLITASFLPVFSFSPPRNE